MRNVQLLIGYLISVSGINYNPDFILSINLMRKREYPETRTSKSALHSSSLPTTPACVSKPWSEKWKPSKS